MRFETLKSLLYLSRSDVEKLGIDALDLLRQIGECARQKQLGQNVLGETGKLHVPHGAQFISKGGYISSESAAGLKWFGLFPSNRVAGLREYHPMMILNETGHGFPVAIMDATWISEFRTAAISAFAATKLADPDSTSIGFIACGAQARAHLLLFRNLFPIEKVYAYSRTMENTLDFCLFAGRHGMQGICRNNPREVVESAEITITSVPYFQGTAPFLDGGWIRPGGFVSMVDRGFSWRAETLGCVDGIFTDDLDLSGPGGPEKVNWNSEQLKGDLADLYCLQQGFDRKRSALMFSGSGLFDVALASLVFRIARSQDAGTVLPL